MVLLCIVLNQYKVHESTPDDQNCLSYFSGNRANFLTFQVLKMYCRGHNSLLKTFNQLFVKVWHVFKVFHTILGDSIWIWHLLQPTIDDFSKIELFHRFKRPLNAFKPCICAPNIFVCPLETLFGHSACMQCEILHNFVNSAKIHTISRNFAKFR